MCLVLSRGLCVCMYFFCCLPFFVSHTLYFLFVFLVLQHQRESEITEQQQNQQFDLSRSNGLSVLGDACTGVTASGSI